MICAIVMIGRASSSEMRQQRLRRPLNYDTRNSGKTHTVLHTNHAIPHHTGWPKKVSRKLLSLSSTNIGRFSKNFHRHIFWKIYNKVVIKYTTTPQLRRYLVKYKSVKSVIIW